uniref:uncharacterized protein LOC122607705 n=1 Tax=Erigeron canadensis TaxID=72917 RepID=UPI001CB94E99|nr:uncharacterized protein LOC122607705 [Erigeron canadensis]XP_043636666.1 uncharacterized protein LOC122607705 [Erigeron canadensis]
MDENIKRLIRPVVVFTTGFDEYYPPLSAPFLLEYQHIYDACSGERKNKLRRRLISFLVRSFDPEDVQCALLLLQGSLLITSNPWKKKKVMYQLAVLYYKSGDYLKSMDLVNRCLVIAPECYKANSLKLILESRINQERLKGMLGIASMILGVGIGVVGPTSLLAFSWVTEAITSIKDHLKKVVDATVADSRNPLQLKEEIYLVGLRYYKRGNYSRSRLVIDCCLEIDPQWEPALLLKNSIESKWCPKAYP